MNNSDHMSVEEARLWVEQEKITRPTQKAARTIVTQAKRIERVRAVLTDLRGQREAALQRWNDNGENWDGAVSDTLHDTIHLLTEALEGEA